MLIHLSLQRSTCVTVSAKFSWLSVGWTGAGEGSVAEEVVRGKPARFMPLAEIA